VKARDLIAVQGELERRGQRAQVNALKASERRLMDALQESEKRFDLLSALRTQKPIDIQGRPKFGALQRTATAVVLCSDWHVEEMVDPKTINGLNEWNPTLARAAVDRLGDGIIWLCRDKRFGIRDLLLWLGGDMITGHIHPELLETCAMSPVEAVLFAQELIEGLIRRLLRETELRLHIPCDSGNHDRTTDKIRVATRAKNSFSWLLYQSLAARITDKRVTWQVSPGDMSYSQVYGWTVRGTHGDQLRFAGGVGGLLIPVRKAIAQWDRSRRADITVFGHWHQYQFDLQGRACMNGSLIGYNAYAQRISASPERRTQAFFLLDEKHGPCQATSIWL
jgi:hypothetical protein